jgi:hypothetical protein
MKPIPNPAGFTRSFTTITLLIFFSISAGLLVRAGDPPSPSGSNTNTPGTNSAAPAEVSTPVKKTLTGAELYSIHCNRCHPERYPTERTAAQWKTIMLHMQIRASIPGKQAKLILEYLQENSGR